MIDEYPRFVNGRNKEDVSRQMEVSVQEGSHGDTAGARLPVIQLSTDGSTSHESAGHTPHPAQTATAAELARYLVRLGLRNSSPRGSPAPEQPSVDSARGKGLPDASTGPTDIFISSTSKLDLVWDNLNLPYTAFFPR